MSFIPRNRFLLIRRREEEKEEKEMTFVLPEDYKPQESLHVVAEILGTSPDCSDYKAGMCVVVDNRMVEEFEVGSEKVELILENYVFGELV